MAYRFSKDQEARQWSTIIAATVHTGCECPPTTVINEAEQYRAYFLDGTIPPSEPHDHGEAPDPTPVASGDHEFD